ncbi:HsdR3 [Desulforapulum autotrophicum HRM2]|uniref:HsdR3 n=1 Tax=Desulforapulum autotrophicum (strain ATCC 43914 / DSM 3382 / VKM B-1955 / HRM2) TaxID=177437 RepID=C0QBN3_DESAH|nr:DEAD/DEAH box helicase family protein [Desulforapulum autotrophicum]ACN17035.1 HsdR3 [Desulforapulum autotrophicum HRM2]
MDIAEQSYLISGGTADPLLPHLLQAIDKATAIQMAVSFTRMSGLRLISSALEEALARKVPFEFLTSDYLDVTEPAALRRLMLLHEAGADVRIHACHNGGAFHTKAYIFIRNDREGIAFIGSSNLSESALTQGIEWNLCIDSCQTPSAFVQACTSFSQLFNKTTTLGLSWDWIEQYEQRRVPIELPDSEIPPPLPAPHPIQERALEALRDSRNNGLQRALVVMATGVGKTWLAVFDILRNGFGRVLFVAHREEILSQAASTFLTVNPRMKVGFFHGNEKSEDADILFGSVQSLGKKIHLKKFDRTAFDYIVIDEFHHASAASYQNILNYFTPSFLLGLTATPERSDGRDIEAFCDNNVAFRFDLTEAIEAGRLCPFTYFGIYDRHVDYELIPWRSRRFDPAEIETAFETQARALQIFEEWTEKGQSRTLGFCVSIHHADFMASFFSGKGVKAVSVHSKSMVRRHDAIDRLSNGLLQIIFCVDLFNEGVDIPGIDTVLMVRPTESPVVYLQQLGRGLRLKDGKERLVVIDFIGNHRSFLQGPQALFGLQPGSPAFVDALKSFQKGTFALPPGCKLHMDLEVIDVFKKMTRINRNPNRIYEYLSELNGRRPTALEMSHYGITFAAIRRTHGSWLQMLYAKADLEPDIFQQLFSHIGFFREMEKTALTKCFKLITLEAMIELNGFMEPPGTAILADKALAVLLRRPVLLHDIHAKFAPHEKIRFSKADEWHRYWLDNPVNALIGGNLSGRKQKQNVFFSVADGKFVYKNPVAPEAQELFESLLQEIVNCRLVGYNPAVAKIQAVVCKLIRSGTAPIIKLNDSLRPVLPKGETSIRINGNLYTARFAKIAVNVIQNEAGENIIADILRNWFGPQAGMPGEIHQVRFVKKDKEWRLEPVQIQPVESASAPGAITHTARFVTDPPVEQRFKTCVPFYTLKAAAGNFGLDTGLPFNGEPAGWVLIDDTKPDMFVLQVLGKSMEPLIPDGAYCLFRGGSALGGSRNGRTVLVQSSGIFDPDTESSFTVKRYRSIKKEDPETGWRHSQIFLESVNKDFKTIQLDPENKEDFAIIGEFVRVLPEPET